METSNDITAGKLNLELTFAVNTHAELLLVLLSEVQSWTK